MCVCNKFKIVKIRLSQEVTKVAMYISVFVMFALLSSI